MNIFYTSMHILIFACTLQSIRGDDEDVMENRIVFARELKKGIEKSWMKLIPYSSILNKIDKIASNGNFSKDCFVDLKRLAPSFRKIFIDGIFTNITEFEANIVLPIVDSSAKLEPGILRGRTTFYGLYSECAAIKYLMKDENRFFEGGYTRLFIDINMRDRKDPNACLAKSNGIAAWGIDICLPKSCSNRDDLFHISTHVKTNGNIEPVCYARSIDEEGRPVDYKTWIVISVMCAVLFIAIIATIYDYYYATASQLFELPGRAEKLLLSFSLYSNIGEIFTTHNARALCEIEPLHFMRITSLIWIIHGHIYMLIVNASANILDTMKIIEDLSTQFLLIPFFAVDTLFYASGLLNAYFWFKAYYQNPRDNMTPYAWILFYVRRLLKTAPPYYMVIAFYTFVLRALMKKSPVYLTPSEEYCEQNWWINFLYLNNFIDYKHQCYGITWYLATDLQMYIFSPILLLPLALKPVVGYLTAIVLLILSTVTHAITIIKFYFPPSAFIAGAMDPRMNDFDEYKLLIYNAPWIRCQVYILGILTAYIIHNFKTVRIPRTVNIILWLLTLGMGIAVILILKGWTNGKLLSLAERALYSSLSRIAWGLGLCYIILSCFYGYGSFVNDYMSWHVWVPFGRVTYCSYLLHSCVETFYFGLSQTPVVFCGFPHAFAFYILPCVIITIFFGTIWSALFEIPATKIDSVLFAVSSKKMDEKQFNSTNSNETNNTKL